MITVKIENYTKVLKKTKVLDNINLVMESGKIYGFTGVNGSGKTMLFRAIAGLIKPTQGFVKINDESMENQRAIMPNIGIVIENIGLYPEFTGFRNLQLLASINKKINDEQIKEAITRVGLNPEDKRIFRKYSLGMKQRIVLAQAIMEKPDILLLDEPTNALDEAGIKLIHNIIKDEAARGALIAIASHSKEDIAALCDVKFRIANGTLEEMDL